MFDLIGTITAARDMHEAAITLRAIVGTGADYTDAKERCDAAFERLCAAFGYRIRVAVTTAPGQAANRA